MANLYDFTPELKQKIQQAIFRYWRQPAACPICNHVQWDMADGFATIPLLKNVWTGDRLSGLPCAAIVCTTCGYTLLFNLVALGLQESLGPDIQKLMDERARRLTETQ